MSNKSELVRRVLAQGPATSGEVAAETGLAIRYCSAVLNRLWSCGQVERSEKPIARLSGPGAYLYALKRKDWKPWTPPEIARMRSMAGRPACEIATALCRSVASVRQQAGRCGVKLGGRKATVWPAAKKMEAYSLRSCGKTYADISDDLGVPLGTVQQWLSRRATGQLTWRV